MRFLELKIHPPIVFILCASLMWAIDQILPSFELPMLWRNIGVLILCIVAISIALSAIIAFRKAQTTVHPHHPEKSTSLVTSGVYQFTRNPMYLGLATLLTAWVIYVMNFYAIIGVCAFIAYITQFQIKPEERILSELFGGEFSIYRDKVRRWL